MHDFLLAKEIIDELKKIVAEKKLKRIKRVFVEIGSVALAHDGFAEHTEDISEENLAFGLDSIAKKSGFPGVEFRIAKKSGNNWKITDIEVE